MFFLLSQVACEDCEAIAERLERVLNLRMVTEDTELHEIVEDCLRIARGLTAQMEMLGRNEDNAQIIDRLFYVLYLTIFLYLLHYFGYNFY